MNLSRLWLLCLAALLPGLLHATTYKWVDAEGNVTYSQQPPPSGDYQRLKVPSGGGLDAAAAQAQREAAAKSVGGAVTDKKQDGAVAGVEADAQALRSKNCEAAKKNLQIYEVYRRVRDADGNVVRLDEKERQARLAQAREQVQEFCD